MRKVSWDNTKTMPLSARALQIVIQKLQDQQSDIGMLISDRVESKETWKEVEVLCKASRERGDK